MFEWTPGFNDVPVDGTEIEVFHRTGQFGHVVFARGPDIDRALYEDVDDDDGGPAWRMSDTLVLLQWSPNSIVAWRIAVPPPCAVLPVPVRREEHAVRGFGEISRLYLSDGSHVYCPARDQEQVERQVVALARGTGLTHAALRFLGTHVARPISRQRCDAFENL